MVAELSGLRPREVVRMLEHAGFRFHHQTGSHAYYRDDRQHTVCVPMHRRDLKKGTLHSIIKQSGLSREEFLTRR